MHQVFCHLSGVWSQKYQVLGWVQGHSSPWFTGDSFQLFFRVQCGPRPDRILFQGYLVMVLGLLPLGHAWTISQEKATILIIDLNHLGWLLLMRRSRGSQRGCFRLYSHFYSHIWLINVSLLQISGTVLLHFKHEKIQDVSGSSTHIFTKNVFWNTFIR